ncbi:beta-microseminoprotein J1-like [Asterias amurensis]|uniref:beta-microseminoprotein J1-like n=1 Tax=Asterias amurensis TaxID=7602 RepID=UPI003AB70271
MASFYIILACSLLLVAGANGSCFQMRTSCEPGPYYDDIPGTSTKCLKCTCNDKGDAVGCCYNIPYPAEYDTKKCVAIFDEDNCQYNVVRAKNPSKNCPVSAWLG